MRRSGWLLLLVATAAVAGCAKVVAFYPALTGKVVEAETASPIMGAKVAMITMPGERVSGPSITGDDGTFVFFGSSAADGSGVGGPSGNNFILEKEGYLTLECTCRNCGDVLVALPKDKVEYIRSKYDPQPGMARTSVECSIK